MKGNQRSHHLLEFVDDRDCRVGRWLPRQNLERNAIGTDRCAQGGLTRNVSPQGGVPTGLAIKLAQGDLGQKPPEVAAALDHEPIRGQKETAIRGLNDVFGVDAAGQLGRQPASRQRDKLSGVAAE